MRVYFLIATLFVCFSILPAQAGQLDNLESEATKSSSKSQKKSSRKANSSSNRSNSNTSSSSKLKKKIVDKAAEGLIKATPDIIAFTAKAVGYSALVVMGGGVGSHMRYFNPQPKPTINNEQDPENLAKDKETKLGEDFFRINGDPLLPTLRVSTHWLYSGNNINTQLKRIEAGYSFLGISYTQNILNEDDDQLTLENTLIHYRMSFHNNFSWDFAYGRGKMNGNQKHDSSVFAMPIRLRFHPDWHFEYYPVWSSYKSGSLAEHQFSFNYHYKYIGANVGYKTWSAGDTTIDGLFTGLYLSF